MWARQPDPELIRLGRLQPNDLHPLVRAALFPGLAAAVPGLAAGADPYARDARGWTPLDVARIQHAPADLHAALVAAGGRHRWERFRA
jgi:hypothetical protein